MSKTIGQGMLLLSTLAGMVIGLTAYTDSTDRFAGTTGGEHLAALALMIVFGIAMLAFAILALLTATQVVVTVKNANDDATHERDRRTALDRMSDLSAR
jgi:hypothetical protein